MKPPLRPSPNPLIFWVIWTALISAVFIYQFALGHGIPQGENQEPLILGLPETVALAQLLIAAAIRWILIPRTPLLKKRFVLMIIGLALSEAVEFYGLFLISATQPQTKLIFWFLALCSCLQFIPFYARNEPPPSDHFRTQ